MDDYIIHTCIVSYASIYLFKKNEIILNNTRQNKKVRSFLKVIR